MIAPAAAQIQQRNRGAPDPNFTGWGRQPADGTTGEWRFETIKPGRVPHPDGRLQAPHISFWIVARGINLGLNTRMYFSDEGAANASDPVLNLIEWEVRRQTLIGQREDRGGKRVVVITLDLIGVSARLRELVTEQLASKFKLPPEAVFDPQFLPPAAERQIK